MKVSSRVAAGVALAALASAPARTGSACGNEVIDKTDANVGVLKRAEQLTNEGRHRAALQILSIDLGVPEGPSVGVSAFQDRVFLTMALAAARLDGRRSLEGRRVGG